MHHHWEKRRRDYYLRRGEWEYSLHQDDLLHRDGLWELYHRHVGDYSWSLLGVYPNLDMADAAI